MRLIAVPLLAAFIALVAAPINAVAEDKPTTEKTTEKTTKKTTTKKAEKLSDADLKVLAHHHHLNQMEIDLAKVAEKKASSADVKKYAAMLVTEHTNADKSAMALVKKRGATLPKEVAETDAEKAEMKENMEKTAKLKKLKGADFDTAYLSQMIQDHETEVQKVDTALTKTTDPDVKELLTNVRPILQKHADRARELQKNMPSS